MRVEYHPEATVDLNEAVRYYAEQQPHLGDQRRSEVYAAIDHIHKNPEMYAEVQGVRRALVRRFPYSVLYRFVPNQCIRVLVIRHHKRHPEYGTGRGSFRGRTR